MTTQNPKKYLIQIEQKPDHHKYVVQQIPMLSPYKLYESQMQYISYIINCLNNKENALVQSPTGSGKTLSLLLTTLSWLKHNENKNQQKIQIIYASRTHSQLKQAISQLKKIALKPRMAILASRQHSCINGQLRMMGQKSKQLQCRLRVGHKNGLSCKYFHYDQYYQNIETLGKIADLQQINSSGLIKCYCPYFYQRSAQQKAHIVFMPYNYLFAKLQAVNLTNSIIIIDEAHNIPSVCQQSQETYISCNNLANAFNQFSEIRQQALKMKNQPDSPLNTINIKHLQMHASFLSNLQIYLQQIGIELNGQGKTLKSKQLLEMFNKATTDSQFGQITKNLKQLISSAQQLQNILQYRPYWAIQAWIYFIQKLHKLTIQQNKSYKAQLICQGLDLKINIFCLDPSLNFKQILEKNPRNIIFTSGTLSPLKTWQPEMKIKFAKPLACQHRIRSQQVNAIILSTTPKNKKLNFNFQNRGNIEMFQQLGLILIDIFKYTSNGVIIFFPSYGLLETTIKHFMSMNIFNKLYQHKTVHYEEKDSKNFKNTLNSYLSSCTRGKGAALFALVRGKVSQGLDFSDQKCRAVVMIGVPYPASKDPKIVSKMEYMNDQNTKNPTDSLNGNQWYLTQTIRSINQSIGRIIRNPLDYGGVYLLDERYNKNDIKPQLTSWVKDNIFISSNYNQFRQKIANFQKIISQTLSQITETNNSNKQFSLKQFMGKGMSGVVVNSQNIKKIQSISQKTPESVLVDNKKMLDQIKSEIQKQKESKIVQKKMTVQRQIFCKPPKKLPISELKQCPVCKINKKLIGNTQCQHYLCQQCWNTWLDKDLRCPLCRIRVRHKFLIDQA